jgi:hypothetical protein
MKIDTDVVAKPIDKPWIEPKWFNDDYVLVASPWGYTKVKADDRSIYEWIDALQEWGSAAWPDTKLLRLKPHVYRHRKLVTKRFWSPVSYYRTDWTAEVAKKCEEHHGPYLLPVPSQDTVHWYAAERTGAKFLRAQQKNHGWAFCHRWRGLQRTVDEVLKA